MSSTDRTSSRHRRRERGFTLAELLVVLVILGLVAVIATPQVIKLLGGAKVRAAKIQVERLSTILDLYYFDAGSYPSDQQGLRVLVERPDGDATWNGPYATTAESLVDPWGHPYAYSLTAGDRPYQITSYGADGEPGGDGENADINLY